jgi:predicted nucleic acid-binding protein
MALLVSDTSVIIDLDRGELLDLMFRLGDEFVVPDLLYRNELDGELGDRLLALGLTVAELSGAEVERAAELAQSDARFSLPDCFAFALARGRAWPLLTGDGNLRVLAEEEGLDVHGSLWVLDRIEEAGICEIGRLMDGLVQTSSHRRSRLPKNEVDRRLKRYRATLE